MMDFSKFLKKYKNRSVRLIAPELGFETYKALDLSDSNIELQRVGYNTSKTLSEYINNQLQKHSKQIAYGGYLEKRAIYKRSDHFKKQSKESQRNIHLGLDFWSLEGTSVHAAFDGSIHSFKNNKAFGDYGPTIVLEHQLEGFHFFTLYGHLSLGSITTAKLGSKIKSGATIGFLGGPKVNGDYPPHLHFQIILDLQGNFGDYPGVCSEEALSFYKSNCPNPHLFLDI